MLRFLGEQVGWREGRLFALASVRRLHHLILDTECHEAMELLERSLDDAAVVEQLTRALDETTDIARRLDLPNRYSPWACAAYAVAACLYADVAAVAERVTEAAGYFAVFQSSRDRGLAYAAAEAAEQAAQASFVRCIYRNPFCPAYTISPAFLGWNDRTVPRLAQAIYDERQLPQGTLDLARLGILADALLDAGCDDEELLAHLRSAGPHVRGCFAVDAILGRS
jgi:hypothetical protein